jgi:hypothetical protein
LSYLSEREEGDEMKQTLMIASFALLAFSRTAMAVPDTVSARVTDVTPSSLSMVWMTDVPSEPAVEVYVDAGMATSVIEGITVTPMPDATPATIAAAKSNGVMKVRVTGLVSGTRYYVRSVTRASADPASVSYSALQDVTTATEVRPYIVAQDRSMQGFSNDLTTMKVYIRPSDQSAVPGLGNLLILETAASTYPLSAFVGSDAAAPEGVIDLNNLFGSDRFSQLIIGGDVTQLRFYRGGALSTLLHYRRLASNSGVGASLDPVKGYFADTNLDGKVDDADFEAFRNQYRSAPDDPVYNPDYKFVQTPSGRVDAQDFIRFANEYGSVNVPAQ